MNRLSAASSSYGMEAEKIRVEHVFIFNISDKWDKPLRQALGAWLDMSWQWVKSCEIIGYGIAAYLVCAGTARLIDAIKGNGKGADGSNGASGYQRGNEFRPSLDII